MYCQHLQLELTEYGIDPEAGSQAEKLTGAVRAS
jgi:hypothetical protein